MKVVAGSLVVHRYCRLPLSKALSVLLLVALGACDSGGSAPAAATLQAADDNAAATWNSSVSVDVLANDHASAGAVELSAVGTPDHGSARIEAGKLVYTPTPGYFGVDNVSYTARAVQGGATATATLVLTVSATLSLAGTAGDASLAHAALVVTVGSASFSTTTDAQGNYSLQVSSSQPADVLVATAVGAGAQSTIRLTSVLGDVATLAARADAAGTLAPLQAPA